MALPDILPDDVFAEDIESDAVKIHQWTREEYEQAAEAGLFKDRRVELVDGVVYDMPPQLSPHATGLQKALWALRAAFPSGWDIRSQLPLALGPKSMPEPDIAVVVGDPDDYLAQHPSEAVLVVEVADSSQFHDRKRKAKIYAGAAFPEYWIVNLRFDVVEVLRDPADGVYRTRKTYRRGETISPLARPDASIAVDDLLPRHAAAS
jgi:Uma2 family endonuclease